MRGTHAPVRIHLLEGTSRAPDARSTWASSPTSTPVRPPSPSACSTSPASSTSPAPSTPAPPRPTASTLERRRGITIKSAVVSFALDDLDVNVIDTPGHPDFIAEVERVLGVLDGAVLVLSAVEGVQPQTRILMRALQRLSVPTLLFVNKIDRAGADVDGVLDAIRRRLTPDILPMGSAAGLGVADRDVHGVRPRRPRLQRARDRRPGRARRRAAGGVRRGQHRSPEVLSALAAQQTRAGSLHPVFAGSAVTGAGVSDLMAAIATLLPRSRRRPPEADEVPPRDGCSRSIVGRRARRSPTSGCSPGRSGRASASTCRTAVTGRSPGSRSSARVGGRGPRTRTPVRWCGCSGSAASVSVTGSGPPAGRRLPTSRRPPWRRRSRRATPSRAPRSAPRWPSSPTRTRSSRRGSTRTAGPPSRSTAASSRRSSPRRWPRSTASRSSSPRRACCTSSACVGSARPWSGSTPRPTRTGRRSASG